MTDPGKLGASLLRTSGRRAILITALVVVAAGAKAAVAAGLRSAASSAGKSVTTTRLACPARALVLAMGPEVVPFTGEHAIAIVIKNDGPRSCLLDGYPAVTIRAGKRELPFSYDDGGGPYLSTAAPKRLTLHPRGHAAFVVAKYRCDAGELAAATTIDIWLPGVPGDKPMTLTGDGVGVLALCRRFKADGPPDLGNTVALSPLELGTHAR